MNDLQKMGGVAALVNAAAYIVGFALGGLPKALNYRGMVIGLAGILTVVSALYEVGMVFGLGFILWFAWVGVVMVRDQTKGAAVSLAAGRP